MLITQNQNSYGTQGRTIRPSFTLGPLTLRFVTVFALSLLALFYLAQSAQSATRDMKVRELETKLDSLKQERDRLNVEAVRLKSLNEIKNNTTSLQLEAEGQVQYIKKDSVSGSTASSQ